MGAKPRSMGIAWLPGPRAWASMAARPKMRRFGIAVKPKMFGFGMVDMPKRLGLTLLLGPRVWVSHAARPKMLSSTWLPDPRHMGLVLLPGLGA